MPTLPRIPNPDGPVVIPAVAEQAFPDLFFVQFIADVMPTLAAGEQFIALRTWPYSYDSGKLHPDAAELETLHKFADPWALAGKYPIVAQAMGAVIQAGTLLIVLRKAETDLEPLQAAVDAATAEKADKETALGEAQTNLVNVTANRDACQKALEDAQAAQTALPPDATDEAKIAAQDAVTAAANALAESLADGTSTSRTLAQAQADVTTATEAVTAATTPRDAQAAIVANIEKQLGA